MKKPKDVPSAREHMRGWKEKKPPKESRVLIKTAIKVMGGAIPLSRFLGITRSAVYQWMPPYRYSPYMPIKMADRFLDDPEIRSALGRKRDR